MAEKKDTESRELSLSSAGTAAKTATGASDQSHEIAEVQAAYVVAQSRPRNLAAAVARILATCERASMAEVAFYTYPRGATQVTGPSIRLAEVLAQSYGNIRCGVREVGRIEDNGIPTAEVISYCVDLETNFGDERRFLVPLVRKAGGKVKILDDARDQYEHIANQGARRKRAAILAVIPADVQEAAVQRCHDTLKKAGAQEGKLAERIEKMTGMFQEKFQVSTEMLEKYLGHKVKATTEVELVRLKGVVRSLLDGHSKPEEYFDLGGAAAGGGKETKASDIAGGGAGAGAGGKEEGKDAGGGDGGEGPDPGETFQQAGEKINPSQVKMLEDARNNAGISDADFTEILGKHGAKETGDLTVGALQLAMTDVIGWKGKKVKKGK